MTPKWVVWLTWLRDKDARQRDLDKFKKWAYGPLMRYNKVKYKILHLGQFQVQIQFGQRTDWEQFWGEGLKVDENLHFTHQWALISQKANHILGCIKIAWSLGQGRWFLHSIPLSWDPTCNAVSSSAVLSTRKMWTSWIESRGTYKDDQRAGVRLLCRQGERSGIVHPGDEKTPERPHCSLSILKGGL